jgi:hypothetical protein
MDRRQVALAIVTLVAVVAVSVAAATVQTDANLGSGGVSGGGGAGSQGEDEDGERVLPTVGDFAPWAVEDAGSGGNGSDATNGGAESGGGGSTRIRSPAVGFAVLLLLGAVVAAVAYRFGRGDDAGTSTEPDASEPESETDDDGSLAAVGRAAGRAADDVATDPEPANGVERAWRDMTAELPVDGPESATPMEFADAAIAAGMSEADVDELTELFEHVRYGGAEPTAERRERATAALRRIERRYGP